MNEQDGSNTIVIYHRACTDGFCAAWVAKKVYPKATFIAAYHGDVAPIVSGKDLIILDFAYPRFLTIELIKKAKSFVLLDHHKTAAVNLAGLPGCVFDMNKSGAGICWDYFKEKLGNEPPWLVKYTEDRDLWRWNLPNSHEVNAAIDSYPHDFKFWDALDRCYTYSGLSTSFLVSEGRAILRFQERQLENIMSHAYETTIRGHSVLAASAPAMFSQVANKLAEGRPFGVSWYIREDGKYVHSLRSTETGMDVEEIAKSFGGGGHSHSAGFTTQGLAAKPNEMLYAS
jgi:oligoribonuclease NrnB/cAMP/cGMP phosphodiesterase (DHH superfamily)